MKADKCHLLVPKHDDVKIKIGIEDITRKVGEARRDKNSQEFRF